MAIATHIYMGDNEMMAREDLQDAIASYTGDIQPPQIFQNVDEAPARFEFEVHCDDEAKAFFLMC